MLTSLYPVVRLQEDKKVSIAICITPTSGQTIISMQKVAEVKEVPRKLSIRVSNKFYIILHVAIKHNLNAVQ